VCERERERRALKRNKDFLRLYFAFHPNFSHKQKKKEERGEREREEREERERERKRERGEANQEGSCCQIILH
jgi:hypothetical protein